jgi:glc operon protein GlcG
MAGMPLTRTRRMLDTGGVDAVMAAAMQAAVTRKLRVVMVVVDASGRVQALRRTEGTQPASDHVAIDKARTAAIFVRPSRELEQQVTGGRLGALALHGARALTGGIPLTVDGEVVGAIGTSGETPDEDETVSIAGARAAFTTVPVPALTHAGARRAAEASGAVARERGVAPVAAVVDAGGDLIYLWRPDAAQVASVGVATDKARTAALFRRPSKDFEDQASGGRPSALHLAGAVPLQGGIPIVIDGHVVGAIGVSGASSADEDQELAVVGMAAVENAATAVAADGAAREAVFIPRQALQERFRTGGLLLDEAGYQVDAGRRTAPGEVELHAGVVDIMHVVEGTATVVTGGLPLESRDVAPGEVRARSIDGGTRSDLSPGDVLVIPSGVPHQFVDVSEPFLYFVAKVEAQEQP